MKYLSLIVILLAASAHVSPWTPIDGPEHSAHIIKSDGGNIYAGTARGLYRSFDNGHSWRFNRIYSTSARVGSHPGRGLCRLECL